MIQQYERFVKPAFDDYIAPTKKHANLIIPNGSDNTGVSLTRHYIGRATPHGTLVH
jgi:uridine kinase